MLNPDTFIGQKKETMEKKKITEINVAQLAIDSGLLDMLEVAGGENFIKNTTEVIQKGGFLECPLTKTLTPGSYIFSFDAEIITDKGFMSIYIVVNGNYTRYEGIFLPTAGNKRYFVRIQVNENLCDMLYLYPQNGYESGASSKAGEIKFTRMKMQRGNIPSY